MNSIPYRRTRGMRAGLKIALAAFLTVFASATARAESLTADTLICKNWDPANCNSFSGTTIASAHVLNGLGGNSIIDATASAVASFGSLGAFASLTLSDYRPGSFQTTYFGAVQPAVDAEAGFTDTWTVLGGSDPNGILNLTFSATGTTTGSGPDGYSGGAGISFNGGDYLLNQGDFSQSFSIPFTLGDPLQISVALHATIPIFDFNFPGPYNYSTTVDFQNTATLTDVEITDASGNPISGAAIFAQSGTVYPINPVNTLPEPSSFLLLGTGLLGLGGTLRRKIFP